MYIVIKASEEVNSYHLLDTFTPPRVNAFGWSRHFPPRSCRHEGAWTGMHFIRMRSSGVIPLPFVWCHTSPVYLRWRYRLGICGPNALLTCPMIVFESRHTRLTLSIPCPNGNIVTFILLPLRDNFASLERQPTCNVSTRT